MKRTIHQLAKEVINVQDACNLSGVVYSFAHVISELKELYPNRGTTWINEHPVCALWSDKITHLTGTQEFSNERVSQAYKDVYAILKGETIDYDRR